jgi:hypothetical protein
VGLLSPYGLMSNLAVVVFIGCFCIVGSLVQVGRGRHSGFLMSGVSKLLQAYVEPSRVCLYWRFFFVGLLVFVRIQFCVSLFLVHNVRPIKARMCLLRKKVFNEARHYKGP